MNHREKILLKILEMVQGVDGIKKVVRQRPTLTEFKSLSNQLFPYAIIEGQAPQPEKLIQEARKGFGQVIRHRFRMKIDIYCYYTQSADPDSDFGLLYDGLYRALYAGDELLAGLVDKMEIVPLDHHKTVFKPYYAFRMQIVVQYDTNGGI